ncbi:MAG: methyl-accepting chemotaxis protein [Candidatus Omnitrophica bacterium]|nr:methyl-accepting chemotaxis protein [Candidatus Omnitrophota bacterium]
MALIKRKIYLIKKSFQLRYALVISVFILLTALLSSSMTYLAVFPYLSEKLANVYPQGRLIALLRNANAKALISTFMIFPFAIWFGIILSHRVAGPWYKLELVLKKLADGDLNHDIYLRKNDELQSLAHLLNDVIRNLRDVAQANVKYAASIDEAIDGINKELGKEPIDAMKIRLMINSAQDIIRDLKESLRRHKLN